MKTAGIARTTGAAVAIECYRAHSSSSFGDDEVRAWLGWTRQSRGPRTGGGLLLLHYPHQAQDKGEQSKREEQKSLGVGYGAEGVPPSVERFVAHLSDRWW